jgi:hypothetical protein
MGDAITHVRAGYICTLEKSPTNCLVLELTNRYLF